MTAAAIPAVPPRFRPRRREQADIKAAFKGCHEPLPPNAKRPELLSQRNKTRSGRQHASSLQGTSNFSATGAPSPAYSSLLGDTAAAAAVAPAGPSPPASGRSTQHEELRQARGKEACGCGFGEAGYESTAGSEFFTPELMLREMDHVEDYAKTGKTLRAGIPNVVLTLFHKMRCKETRFYADVKDKASLVEMESKLTRILGFESIGREKLQHVLQAVFPLVHVHAGDCEVLFDLIDGDRNGDVGVAEICNGLLLLLADDLQALLQRCRNIVSTRPRQTLCLVYLSRYELLLVVDAVLTVYRGHREYAEVKRLVADLLNAFDFTLRGRIQLKEFHDYCNDASNGRVKKYLVDALDRYCATENTELAKLTVFERTAGEDDQERTFTSRRAGAGAGGSWSGGLPGRGGRPANAFAVDDAEAQRLLPYPLREKLRVLRGREYELCSLVSHNEETGVAVVEWDSDGVVQAVDHDKVQLPQPGDESAADAADAAANAPSVFTETVTQLMDIQKNMLGFRKNKLVPVPPLRERAVQEEFEKCGNVLLPKIELTQPPAVTVSSHFSRAARVLGLSLKAPHRGATASTTTTATAIPGVSVTLPKIVA